MFRKATDECCYTPQRTFSAAFYTLGRRWQFRVVVVEETFRWSNSKSQSSRGPASGLQMSWSGAFALVFPGKSTGPADKAQPACNNISLHVMVVAIYYPRARVLSAMKPSLPAIHPINTDSYISAASYQVIRCSDVASSDRYKRCVYSARRAVAASYYHLQTTIPDGNLDCANNAVRESSTPIATTTIFRANALLPRVVRSVSWETCRHCGFSPVFHSSNQ